MRHHLLKHEISQEVHARPFQKLYPDIGVVHIAATCSDEDRLELPEYLTRLLHDVGITVPDDVTAFFHAAGETTAVRYEPHNEFYTLTLYQLEECSTARLKPYWDNLPGEMLCGVEILFEDQQAGTPNLKKHFCDRQVSGAEIMGGAARAWTDFFPAGDDGLVRILIQNVSLKSFQAGRLIQRFCEIETYRHTALLALPDAKRVMPQITHMDQQLSRITHEIAQHTSSQELLKELMLLAASVEELSAATANRFSASEAYFTVLDSRIAELREDRIEGLQTIAQFVERRLDPARKTCLSASDRIERLSVRIQRATELIRSQVDLSIERQNQQLLTRLNDRSRRQLRLQAKLESFTIIVVTYYAFDLLERSIRNTVSVEGLRDDILLWVSFSVPVIAGLLWWYVRRLLKHYGEDDL